MRALDFRKHQIRRDYRLSGGKLPYSLTPAQRLMLIIWQRRLKADFLRRSLDGVHARPSSTETQAEPKAKPSS